MSDTLTIDATVKRRQATASNPALSAWVGANAGSGKTYVLSRRVIRLLLEGADPSKILCLTFTKAAAAEMSERVFKALAQWTTAADDALFKEMSELTDKAPSDEQMREARRLFAKALETPGGLKIQTIHAFCERLLHQFPVEANVAGHFEVLDDAGKEQLLREAERDVLLEAAHNPNGEIAANLSIAIAHASDMGYQKALRSFLNKQQTLLDWIEEAGGLAGAIKSLQEHFNLGDNETLTGLQEQMLELPNFPPVYMESLRQELAASSVKFQAQAALSAIILSHAPIAERQKAIIDFFFTKKGDPKKLSSVASKDIVNNFSDLELRLDQEQERLIELLDKQKAVHTLEATQALLTLGLAVAKSYTAHKSTSGMMDFDDLIHKSANLLEKPDAAAWVHYKLDQGLDHILVDEAQDTSPRQWDVVKHLADEFFSGEGARALKRTLFAVGDEKQSIYSFQGASPEKFSAMRKHFEARAQNAEQRFEKVALSLSFRSTADVLSAVDLVCGNDVIKGYLTNDYEDHTAARQNQPGFVELWAPFPKPKTATHQGPWWQPMDRLDQSEQVRLAEKLASTIKTMLDTSERLEGTGTLISAGDILILTRKRGAQVEAINRALKAHGIAVAGSDRLKLMDNIAILDLLALADFVLLSEDDLALAGLLKSPLIGLTEDDLFALAHGRSGTLWKELYERGKKGDPRFFAAYERLDAWRREADFVPPYDFFLRVLSRDHGRQAFLQGLGRETDELLEAFLTQVQTYEQTEVPSLQGFVSWFRNGAVEIKRDMESARDEVRVMTVHGSKGLEAPIVFLIDGSAPVHAAHQPDILGLGQKGDGPFIWKRSAEHKTKAQSDAIEREKSAAMAEYYRLLYVAMTRARDRLYIASTASDKGDPPKQGWFDIAHKALAEHEHTTPHLDEAGETVAWRWCPSKAESMPAKDSENILEKTIHKPDWLSTKARPHAPAIKPIAPSRAGGGYDEIESSSKTGRTAFLDVDPLQRGLLMHRLLERLPSLSPSQREEAALHYLKANLPDADHSVQAAMTAEVLAVLNSPLTAALFTEPNAQCEVPVYGTITQNDATHTVRGEIDRLIVTQEAVHIIDFKTNRTVPDQPGHAPTAYVRQLALYCALLRPLFPDHTIKASLLWTHGPILMPIEESDLAQALKGL